MTLEWFQKEQWLLGANKMFPMLDLDNNFNINNSQSIQNQ